MTKGPVLEDVKAKAEKIAESNDGFIYFNEMLYRVMRAQFGRVKINKFMVLQELVTQFKMLQLTLQAKSV